MLNAPDAVLDLSEQSGEPARMKLADLNVDERTALVGLVKAVVLSDSIVSQDEIEEVREIVNAFGEESYRHLLDAFESRFPNEETFKVFLKTVVRQDARELIYGTVVTGAAADAIEGHESELLSWLAETWNVEMTVAE